MRNVWTRGICIAVVGLFSLALVADASAFGHHRRRGCGGYGGCGGCGGGYMGGPAYYGKGGYGYGSYGYGGGYARYAPMPAYYGGTYGGGGSYASPAIGGAAVGAGQIAPNGTANAEVGPNDRSARANRLVPAQGGADANVGAPNADQGAPSNSDIRPDAGIQGNADAAGTGGADASLRAAPPVAPGTR